MTENEASVWNNCDTQAEYNKWFCKCMMRAVGIMASVNTHLGYDGLPRVIDLVCKLWWCRVGPLERTLPGALGQCFARRFY